MSTAMLCVIKCRGYVFIGGMIFEISESLALGLLRQRVDIVLSSVTKKGSRRPLDSLLNWNSRHSQSIEQGIPCWIFYDDPHDAL